jgi:hypothetical protein
MQRGAIGTFFRRLVKRAGLPGQRRFHSLRAFARTAFEHSGVKELYAEKLIGHGIGSLKHLYTPATTEELRGYYKMAIPELTFFGESPETKEKVARVEDELEKLRKENAELKDFMRVR